MARATFFMHAIFGSRRRRFAASGTAVLSSLLLALPAWGGAGLGGTVTYPPSVEVGQTNLPVSIDITNVSNPTTAVTLTSIKHTPSCAVSASPCPGGSADPGVFLVRGPAIGRQGTDCAGIMFTIGSPNPSTGEVTLAPNSSVTLTATGSVCSIDFHVDVLSLPSKDAAVNPGVQTFAVEASTGTSGLGGAGGSGGALVAVLPETVEIPAPAMQPVVLALVGLLLAGFGVLRLSRRAAAPLGR